MTRIVALIHGPYEWTLVSLGLVSVAFYVGAVIWSLAAR